MNATAFVNNFRQAVRQLLDAADAMQTTLDQYGDVGSAATLDVYFANTTQPALDPLAKQDVIDAGGAAAAVIAALGVGAGSNRAKLNKLR